MNDSCKKTVENGSKEIKACVLNIASYFSSRMGLGGGAARYLVSVDIEVAKIEAVIDKMAKLSLKHKTAKPIMAISDRLRDTWNRYEEKSRNNRPNCTLENYWFDGDFVGDELVEVRGSMLDAGCLATGLWCSV